MKKTTTIETYSMEDTTNPNIKKYVDRKGDWTHYWLVKEQRFVKAVNHILTLGYSKGPQFRIYLETHTQEQIAKTLREKGDEGTRTHRAIRDLIRGMRITMNTKYPSELNANRQETLNDDEWDNLMAFERWCARYAPRTIAYEESISDGDAAGTMDWLGVITVPSGDKVFEKPFWGKDVVILIDWKSSAAVWTEYESQVAKYWHMAKSDSKVGKKLLPYIHGYKGHIFTGILRLGSLHTTGYHFTYFTQKQAEGEHLDRFNAAKVIADRYEPEFKPKVEQLPTQFIIKVPKAKAPKMPVKVTTKKLPL